MKPSILKLAAELEQQGQGGALCTIIESRGSTPRHTGSKMLVYADGNFAGTVGGGELENRVLREALQAIADGRPRKLSYNMTDPAKGDPGVCGGQVEVWVEPILPPEKIVVIGAGHVGRAVAHLAKWLGFSVAASDDRPEFCTPEAIPDADEYYPCPMSELPKQMVITPRTYLILTTRGVTVDIEGLPALLETPAGFIGVIGSRRRWSVTEKTLAEKGIPAALLKKIRSPVGIELHAETPEEIAVSILAEIMMIRTRATGKPMRG